MTGCEATLADMPPVMCIGSITAAAARTPDLLSRVALQYGVYELEAAQQHVLLKPLAATECSSIGPGCRGAGQHLRQHGLHTRRAGRKTAVGRHAGRVVCRQH